MLRVRVYVPNYAVKVLARCVLGATIIICSHVCDELRKLSPPIHKELGQQKREKRSLRVRSIHLEAVRIWRNNFWD